MKINYKLLAVVAISFLCSCDSKSQHKFDATKSVETEKPNSLDLKPAFPGQTRIAAVKSKTAYKSEVLNASLGKPWGIAQLPDGRFLVTEKSGFVNLVSADGKTNKKIQGFPKVDASGQGGLLDIAVDPDFQKN